MGSYSDPRNKNRNKFSFILMVVIVAFLSFMLAACDFPGVNANNNGYNNGNNSPSNNCNGVNNCNSNNNSNPNPIINNGSGTTQQGGSTSPIAQGDFLYNPGSVTGPAIVEFWNGQDGASKVCGTFQLSSGESFTYKAGHWWQYKSDQDMQAEWSGHVALFTQKSENAGCTVGQWPPS